MREIIVHQVNNIKMKAIDEEDVKDIRKYIIIFKKDPTISKEFKNRFKISIETLIAFGKTDKVSTNILRDIIPKLENGEYKCYLVPKPLIVMHEDLQSSWSCLLLKCGNPKHVMIYKDGQSRAEKQDM